MTKVVQIVRTGPGYYLLLHEDGAISRGVAEEEYNYETMKTDYRMKVVPVEVRL